MSTAVQHQQKVLPPPEAQKGWFATLEAETKLKEGDAWYLLSYRWWGQWKGYTGYKETKYHYYSSVVAHVDEPPPPIDNSHLLTLEGELRRDITEMRDYILVDEKQWDLLTSWYGGGPVIKRHVVNTPNPYSLSHLSIEVHLLRIYLVRSSNDKVKVRKLCSKAMTCGELMKLGLEEFDMKEEDTRMFDYHGDKRIKRLNEMNTTLASHQILDTQKIMFDEIPPPTIPPPIPPLPSSPQCSPRSPPLSPPSSPPPYNLQDAILSRLKDAHIQHQIVARNQKMEEERRKEEKEALKADIVALRGQNVTLVSENEALRQHNGSLLLENERLRHQNDSLLNQNETNGGALKRLEDAPFMDGLLPFWLSLSKEEMEVITQGMEGKNWGGGWRDGVKAALQNQLLGLMRRIRRVEERVKAMEEWMGEEDVDRESVKVAREKALEVQGGLEEECSRWVELYNRVSRV